MLIQDILSLLLAIPPLLTIVDGKEMLLKMIRLSNWHVHENINNEEYKKVHYTV